MTGSEDSICQASDCPGHVSPLPGDLTDLLRCVCVKGLGVTGSMPRTRHTVVLMAGICYREGTQSESAKGTRDGRRNPGEPGTLLQASPRGVTQESAPSQEQWQPM